MAHRENDLVLSSATLVLETKIRGVRIGHIKDTVTHREHRGIGVGQSLVDTCVQIARIEGCYQAALHCGDHNFFILRLAWRKRRGGVKCLSVTGRLSSAETATC